MTSPTRKTPTSGAIRWPSEEDGPFEVEFTFDNIGDRFEVVATTIRQVGTPTPMTAKVIKSIPFGALMEKVRRRQLMSGKDFAMDLMLATMGDPLFKDSYKPEELEEAREAALRISKRLKPRAKSYHYDDAHYEAVARVYNRAIEAGSPAPRREIVAWAHGRGDEISSDTAKGWIDAARERGLDLLPYDRPAKKQTKKSAKKRGQR